MPACASASDHGRLKACATHDGRKIGFGWRMPCQQRRARGLQQGPHGGGHDLRVARLTERDEHLGQFVLPRRNDGRRQRRQFAQYRAQAA
jgi:hypothetical protein